MLAGLFVSGFPKVGIATLVAFDSMLLAGAALVIEANEIVGAEGIVMAAVDFAVFPKENPEELITVVVLRFSAVDLGANIEELMLVLAVVAIVLVSALDIFDVGAAAAELETVEDGNENPPVEAGFRELADVEVAREEAPKL